MIVYKYWKEVKDYGLTVTHCSGYYLFGIIPLYIRRLKVKG
jgi:hypothetical protein